MQWGWWLLAGFVSLLLLMVVSRSVVKPLRWVWYGILYTAVGGLVLFVLNLAGDFIHFRLPINPVTALITGFLGLPGLICLIVIKLFLVGG